MAHGTYGQTQHVLDRNTTTLDALVQDREVEAIEYRGLSMFTMNNPLKFDRGFDFKGEQHWLAKTEKIFEAMSCVKEHKVMFAMFTLSKGAQN